MELIKIRAKDNFKANYGYTVLACFILVAVTGLVGGSTGGSFFIDRKIITFALALGLLFPDFL